MKIVDSVSRQKDLSFRQGTAIRYIDHIGRVSMDIRRKPISTLERDIIVLLHEGKTYSEVGSVLGYEDGYIGDVSREVYGLVGQYHKIKISRSNLFSALDSVMGGDLDDSFYVCHNIKAKSVVNPGVIHFNQKMITIDVSLFWKLDAINHVLILKTKHPVVFYLKEINSDNLGSALINLSRQSQVSGDALLELVKILDKYFES